MTPDDLIRARFGTLPFAPPLEIPPALAALLDRRVTRRSSKAASAGGISSGGSKGRAP